MKEDKKNIDRLFQEKFRDFEASPAEENWDKIREKLTEEKDSRKRIFPIWVKIAGIAAVILALFIIGSLWFNTDQNPTVVNREETTSFEETQKSISDTQSDENKVDETNAEVEIIESEDAQTATQNLASSNNEEINVESAKQRDNKQVSQLGDENDIQPKTSVIAKIEATPKDEMGKENNTREIDLLGFLNPTGKDKKSDWNFEENEVMKPEELVNENVNPDESQGKSLFDEIAKQEAIEQDEQTATGLINRFAVRPNVAPIYYNSMKGGSAVDPSLAGNKSEGDVTMSYGVDLSYAVSSRIKVRTGVSRVNMSYSTPDIAFISAPNRGMLNVNDNPQAKDILVVKRDAVLITPQEISENSAAPYTFGKLNQQLEYIEVPIEVELAVLDKKFGINVIGGASTLFLKDDFVRLNSEMGTTDLGRANNLNSVSFTTNIGVGFDYNITETFNLNIEPTFKYQVNGFSGDSGGFKPYFFGVYSGVSMRF